MKKEPQQNTYIGWLFSDNFQTKNHLKNISIYTIESPKQISIEERVDISKKKPTYHIHCHCELRNGFDDANVRCSSDITTEAGIHYALITSAESNRKLILYAHTHTHARTFLT